MNSNIIEHIERVRKTLSECVDEHEIVEQVTASKNILVSGPVSLPPEKKKMPNGGYGRNLLHHDEEHDFVVLALVWPPHAETEIHNHETWGVVGVTEGNLNETNYIQDKNSESGISTLTQGDTISAGAGMATNVLPPNDIHKVCNPNNQIAISIHTYGEKIESCNKFNLDDGSVERMQLTYSF